MLLDVDCIFFLKLYAYYIFFYKLNGYCIFYPAVMGELMSARADDISTLVTIRSHSSNMHLLSVAIEVPLKQKTGCSWLH
jgi:hypothetical protein